MQRSPFFMSFLFCRIFVVLSSLFYTVVAHYCRLFTLLIKLASCLYVFSGRSSTFNPLSRFTRPLHNKIIIIILFDYLIIFPISVKINIHFRPSPRLPPSIPNDLSRFPNRLAFHIIIYWFPKLGYLYDIQSIVHCYAPDLDR